MKRKSSDLTEFYIQFLIVVYLLWSFPVLSFGQKEVLVPADGTVSEGEEQPVVALTFDDGPSGTSTPVLLEGLRKRGVRATFFVVGENVEKGENAQILREMSADGHLIGNHTYHHVNLSKMSAEQAQAELDATDELALETLPLREIDVVIVAIGENFGASVRVVALLKQKKVKHIFARAIDSVHKAILEVFAIDKVLTPEKDAAREFVQFLALGIHAESFRVDEDYYVIKFKVPRKCAGYPLSGMNLEEDFHLKLIALKQAAEVKNILGMKKLTKEVMTVIPDNYLLKEEDELVCYGLYKDFQALWKAF